MVRPRRIFYGWWLLAAAVLCMTIASGVTFWAVGIYVVPLEEEFGWSRWSIQFGVAIGLLAAGLAAPLTGKVIQRYGARRCIAAGTVATLGSFVLLAQAETLWQWFLFQGINNVMRGFMFYVPFQVIISTWFDRKRGRAVGILAIGFSLGGLIVPVMQWIVDNVGWQESFIFAGGIITAFFLPVSLLLLRNHPQDKGLEVDGEPRRAGAGPSRRAFAGLTVSEAVRTPNFWAIAFAFMFFFFGMFGWMSNGFNVYEDYEISRPTASLLFMAGSIGGVISRPTFGFLAERIPSIELASVVLALFMAGGMAALLITGGSYVGIGIFICCWFIGSAGGPVLEPLILPRVFGLAHFAAIMGTMFMVETMGQFAAPQLGGLIHDWTGSYDPLLAMFMLSLVLSMGFFVLAWKLPNPRIPPLAAAPAVAPRPAAAQSNGSGAAGLNGASPTPALIARASAQRAGAGRG